MFTREERVLEMNMGALPCAHNMVVGIVLKTTGETMKDKQNQTKLNFRFCIIILLPLERVNHETIKQNKEINK